MRNPRLLGVQAIYEWLATTAKEHGISIGGRSETWTSQECPQCGSTNRIHRHEDLPASAASSYRFTDVLSAAHSAVRPMAPVRLEWDSDEWLEISHSHRPKQQRTDPSTVHCDGNVTGGEST